MNSIIFYDALELIVLCGIVNIALNLLGAVKRITHSEKLDVPFDFGFHLGKNRILGTSTTWGGLLLSLVIGLLIQKFYSDTGIIIALSCFFGHALGSFIKRRFSISDGVYLPIVDHGDYVILTGAVLLIMDKVSVPAYILSVVMILAIHPFFCILGYKLGIREKRL